MFRPLLLEGRAGQTWESANKKLMFQVSGSAGWKTAFTLCVFQCSQSEFQILGISGDNALEDKQICCILNDNLQQEAAISSSKKQ
jgi:hypothetical protein